jgi:diguanylate cyclase (GGDEF)-like protein
MHKALVIDDSRSIHALVAAHLGRQFELSSAFDGQSGLTTAKDASPEFILLDVDLPDLNGYEVCRRLKEDPATRTIPVIFLSSGSETRQKIQGLDSGACDYVTKPFEPWELRARVRAALRSKQAVDEMAEYALIDSVTGLFNRRYFESRLEGELARARRSGHPLGCLLIGLDSWKHIDPALRTDNLLFSTGRSILQACRREDVVCQFEDEEFAVLTIGADEKAVRVLADRIQTTIAESERANSLHAFPVSVSVGVALSRFSTGSSIVLEAAVALNKARAQGGGQTVVGHEIVELRLAG